MSSRSLKISQGKTEISQSLEVGTYDVRVLVTGDIVQELHNDAQDGSIEVVYVLKATNVEIQE